MVLAIRGWGEDMKFIHSSQQRNGVRYTTCTHKKQHEFASMTPLRPRSTTMLVPWSCARIRKLKEFCKCMLTQFLEVEDDGEDMEDTKFRSYSLQITRLTPFIVSETPTLIRRPRLATACGQSLKHGRFSIYVEWLSPFMCSSSLN